MWAVAVGGSGGGERNSSVDGAVAVMLKNRYEPISNRQNSETCTNQPTKKAV